MHKALVKAHLDTEQNRREFLELIAAFGAAAVVTTSVVKSLLPEGTAAGEEQVVSRNAPQNIETSVDAPVPGSQSDGQTKRVLPRRALMSWK